MDTYAATRNPLSSFSIRPAFELAASNSASPKASMDQIIGTLAKKNDVVMVADTNHFDASLHKPLHSKTLYATAKQNGVTDLYIELPREFQGDLNDLLGGNISKKTYLDRIDARYKEEGSRFPSDTFSKDEFKQTRTKMGDFADIAIAAHKAGLNVHAADPQSVSEMMDISEAIKTASTDKIIKMAEHRLKTYDYDLADDIHSTSKGKSMVVYGALHILPDKRHSLDDILERKGHSVGVVALDDAKPSTSMKMALDMKDKGARLDVPDYIYNPKTREFATSDSFTGNTAPTLKAVLENNL